MAFTQEKEESAIMKWFLSALTPCFASAVFIGGGFAFFGVVIWIFTGDPIGILALGSFGLAFGLLVGIGRLVIRRLGDPHKPSVVFFPQGDESAKRNGEPTSDVGWIVAFIWPSPSAQPADLQTLGGLLEHWKREHPSVNCINGLELLLQGRFPVANEPPSDASVPIGDPISATRQEQGEVTDEPRQPFDGKPRRECPVLVWSVSELDGHQAIASLKAVIPETLATINNPLAR